MNVRQTFAALEYRGRVASIRRVYHVFEGASHMVVVSPRTGTTGNYSVVPWAAVHQITRKLGGRKSITTRDAYRALSRSRFFGDRFALLNALYAMVALKQARITRRDGRTLYFGVARAQ